MPTNWQGNGSEQDPGKPPNRGVLKKVCENGKNAKIILLKWVLICDFMLGLAGVLSAPYFAQVVPGKQKNSLYI
jgi:hypothetical protein